MKKKFFKQLIFLLSVFDILQAEQKVPKDDFFEKFCKDVGGTHVNTQADKGVVTQGQRCKNADFGGVWAGSKDEAEEACRMYGPFHLVKSDVEKEMIRCTYESLFVCRNGFKQINGRCYRIENSLLSTRRADAAEICQRMGLKLYHHYDERTAAFINIFFRGLSAIWAYIPNNQVLYDIAHESGEEYAVAFGTANVYDAPYNSLIKIPADHYAMVMCEYTPKESIMSLRAKIEKWAPYIFKAVVDGAFTAWRTFGHHLPDLEIHGTLFEDHQKVCQSSLSAIMNSSNVKMFDTKKTFMNQLGNRLEKSMVFLAPFRRCKYGHRWCSASSAWTDPKVPMTSCWGDNKRYFWTDEYQTYPCELCKEDDPREEQDDLGYYMAYHESGKYQFYATRPKPAPILCDVMFHAIGYYKDCDSGWTQVPREDGSKACHKYHTQSKTRDEAHEYCKNSYGATLAGWHSDQEMKMIFGFGQGWVNMKKRSYCGSMSADPASSCYQHLVFYDPDEATNEIGKKAFVHAMYSGQPQETSEYCFVWYTNHYVGIHDYGCESKFEFTCTYVTEMVEPELNYGYG